MTCLTKEFQTYFLPNINLLTTVLLKINYSTTKLITVLPESGVLGHFEPNGEIRGWRREKEKRAETLVLCWSDRAVRVAQPNFVLPLYKYWGQYWPANTAYTPRSLPLGTSIVSFRLGSPQTFLAARSEKGRLHLQAKKYWRIIPSCRYVNLSNISCLQGTTEDWYDKGESGPYPGLIIRKANKKLLKHPRMAFVAHFYFRSNLNLPQAHTYINQVRDPIRRLVSHYHYMRSTNRPTDRIKEFLNSGERNESLKQCFGRQHKGCRNNVMTRFFCGRHSYCLRGNWRSLQKAKHNIKRYYAAVGLLEHYEVYLQILYRRLPKFFREVSSYDIGKYNPTYSFDNVPKDLISEITKANWADARLYSFVKKRFWQQAKVCGFK